MRFFPDRQAFFLHPPNLKYRINQKAARKSSPRIPERPRPTGRADKLDAKKQIDLPGRHKVSSIITNGARASPRARSAPEYT
jgi:hypothetical protein